MRWTKQRNGSGGRAVVSKSSTEIIFGGVKETRILEGLGAKQLYCLLKERKAVHDLPNVRIAIGKPILSRQFSEGDEVWIYLKTPVRRGFGSVCDLLIVSKRGLLRAARLAMSE